MTTKNIGYIRVSTTDQNTDRQLAGLTLDKVFEEKVSASTMNRPELTACLEFLREGDTLHIHSLDRVCRSGAGDAVKLVKELNSQGIKVHFHKEQMLFGGKMSAVQQGMLSILASVAEMERNLIKERQAEGIAAARAAGKHLGRPKTTVTKADINALLEQGIKKAEAARQLNISRNKLYEILRS